MINVTKPFLPPLDDYTSYITDVFKRSWLTNNGPLVNELELKLREYLEVPHLLFLSNGTIALQIAIKALDLKGEIITTPFSYVATTSVIAWEGCTPVFVDVDPETMNIDPRRIQEAITDKTSAILATHVYGNPCDIDAIQEIADRHNLKVIYDAAHCFGTKYKGKSVFNFGDISTTSFHATKLFHTVEGGAVFCKDPELLRKMAYMRNFGHDTPESFQGIGINGKNSEMHAAMGLCNLKYIDDIIDRRKKLCEHYDSILQKAGCVKPQMTIESEFNYAYYPVIFESEELVVKLMSDLHGNNIFPRRYFYPSLNTCLPYTSHPLQPNSDSLSKRVMTLPLYYDLSFEEVDFIGRIILRTLNN